MFVVAVIVVSGYVLLVVDSCACVCPLMFVVDCFVRVVRVCLFGIFVLFVVFVLFGVLLVVA